MSAYAFARVALAAAVSSLVLAAVPAWSQAPDATPLAADVVAELVAAPDLPANRARLSAHFLAVAAQAPFQVAGRQVGLLFFPGLTNLPPDSRLRLYRGAPLELLGVIAPE